MIDAPVPSRPVVPRGHSGREPEVDSTVSVALRTAVYVLIAIPFFGMGWVTWLSAVLLAVPMVLKVWEDDLPNAVWLNKWFPRGLTRFALLLVLANKRANAARRRSEHIAGEAAAAPDTADRPAAP